MLARERNPRSYTLSEREKGFTIACGDSEPQVRLGPCLSLDFVQQAGLHPVRVVVKGVSPQTRAPAGSPTLDRGLDPALPTAQQKLKSPLT